MVQANSHVFTEFDDSGDSPKWAFIHSYCCDVGSGSSRDANVYMHTYRYTSISISRQADLNELLTKGLCGSNLPAT